MATYSSCFDDKNNDWRLIRPEKEHKEADIIDINGPSSSKGNTRNISETRFGYLSSDEEADLAADINDLTNVLVGIEVGESEGSEREMARWIALVQKEDAQKIRDYDRSLRVNHTHDLVGMEVRESEENEKEAARWIALVQKEDAQKSQREIDIHDQHPSERGDCPSGLTTAGPVRNMDIDPCDLTSKVTYPRMRSAHELNITDDKDECCNRPIPEDVKEKLGKRNTLKCMLKETKKSLTLPSNLTKWNAATTSTKRHTATVVKKYRSLVKSTSKFFHPLLRIQDNQRTCPRNKNQSRNIPSSSSYN